MTVDLSLFWGKAGEADRPHPAICHMIDVGNVVRVFLERPAANALRARIERELGTTSEAVVKLAAFLAAAHDIGKVSSGFQRKRGDLWRRLAEHDFSLDVDADPDHGRVTVTVLKRFLKGRLGNVELALALARIVAGHHGSFPQARRFADQQFRQGAWAEAQQAHLLALEGIFEPQWKALEDKEELAGGALITIAGLTSVCDWIGSAEEFFPYEPVGTEDLRAYVARSLERAREAVRRVGLTGWTPSAQSLDFVSTFGFQPNAMQQVVVDAAARLQLPGMLVLEAPMGLGKTEAALAAADDLVRRFGLAGVYYALPTQATSNQMFGRLRRFLERRYEGVTVDLHLLHGLSDLNEAYREIRLAAISQDPDATVRASSWFTAAKRGLLAPFGVGTIDQALLAAMSVRHMFVRLLGLADKVVIFDEVHAYDTYMSELLDHLVSWLAALGSPVIVLSATLPASRRNALVEAYTGEADECPSAGYPQVTTARPGEGATVSSSLGPAPTSISLEKLPAPEDGSLDHAAQAIASRISRGGCAAWICNTVDAAQRAYQTIRRVLPDDCEHLLFHARFPTGQRLEIEQKALEWLGKDGKRPQRAVLVATQVVEQSLDLDFDLMVTDLAPVDLVLQRAGRLHRHQRARPAGLESPTLLWIDPPVQDELPVFGTSGYVYEPVVLLRSWMALRERPEVNLPADVPALVERVYTEEQPDTREPFRSALAAAQRDFDRRRDEHQLKAIGVEFVTPTGIDELFRIQEFLDDDETAAVHQSLRAQTRLTRPSVTIVCAARTEAGLELMDGTLLDLEQDPQGAVVRAIRLSSVTIQRPEWVKHFSTQSVPGPWRRRGVLRNCRIAEFDRGTLAVDGLRTRLELSPELGLVVRDNTIGRA